MAVSSSIGGVNLIDELLKDQQSLTAVEKFSQLHDRGALPQQESYYRKLIPAKSPGEGEQYSFEVNLDACTGCKACVTACHSLNGLDEHESWRDVGVLFGGTKIKPKQQTVTTACHHCADPACLNGCPVLAYSKDKKTGVVRHLDDQCIGCQYCILKCPYDVPKYNPRLGIVRKCDMCIDRLEEGEAPACVQACPTQAITIKIVKVAGLASGKTDFMLPGAFRSDYTKPTTSYMGSGDLPENMAPGDVEDLTPEHNHTPLVGMLVLTQVSIGVMTAAWIFSSAAASPWMSVAGLILGFLGMASSFCHLGSPSGAWRAFLGLRKSWLSREIVVLGTWFPLAMVHTASFFFGFLSPLLVLTGYASSAMGLLGIFCSVMVYVDTRREFWNFRQSASRFFGTALVSFSMASAALGFHAAIVIGSVIMLGKMAVEGGSLLPFKQTVNLHSRKTARIQLITLRGTLLARAALALIAVTVFAIAGSLTSVVIVSLLCITPFLLGEFLERSLYFRAVAAPRMPGAMISRPDIH
ncbi:MAG: DmsC/YnfH family molybdoenzyme membrane anchor subunit [Akkermansiaceae bacterium]